MKDLPPPSAWREETIHSSYVRAAIEMAQSFGLQAVAPWPEGARLIPLMDALPLLHALCVAGNPHLGAHLGSIVPASTHGAMGYAAVSSPTVGAAMDTIARYAPMRNRMFSYAFVQSGTEAVLSVKPRMELAEFGLFLEIATAVSIFKIVQSAAGDSACANMTFDATWPKATALNVPMKMRYSRKVSALHVPLSIANMATTTVDAKLYASACRSCDEALKALEGNLAARLRSVLPDENQQWMTLKEAANCFAMAPRTMIRKLVSEGLTYQGLLDESKSELACWYLSSSSLSIGSIAEKLGFSDDTNFSRSFRRWRNLTPLEYRKKSQMLQV